VHQLEIKVLNIIDARCNNEVQMVHLLLISCKYMQNARYAQLQVLRNVHYHIHTIPSLYNPTPYLTSILLQ